jgi:hypothetical protein
MSRRQAAFTQAQVSRAARCTIKAGLAVSRVEIDASGKIVIICAEGPPSDLPPEDFEARLRSATGWER